MNLLIGTVLILSCIWDLKYRKIPNFLTFVLAAGGFVLSSLQGGLNGALLSLAGLFLGLMLLYFPFALGGMGGGDVKLLAALGACLGPSQLIFVFLGSAAAGGVFSLLAAAQAGALQPVWTSLKNRILYLALARRIEKEGRIGFNCQPIHVPYALAIGSGYLLFLLLGGGS